MLISYERRNTHSHQFRDFFAAFQSCVSMNAALTGLRYLLKKRCYKHNVPTGLKSCFGVCMVSVSDPVRLGNRTY